MIITRSQLIDRSSISSKSPIAAAAEYINKEAGLTAQASGSQFGRGTLLPGAGPVT